MLVDKFNNNFQEHFQDKIYNKLLTYYSNCYQGEKRYDKFYEILFNYNKIDFKKSHDENLDSYNFNSINNHPNYLFLSFVKSYIFSIGQYQCFKEIILKFSIFGIKLVINPLLLLYIQNNPYIKIINLIKNIIESIIKKIFLFFNIYLIDSFEIKSSFLLSLNFFFKILKKNKNNGCKEIFDNKKNNKNVFFKISNIYIQLGLELTCNIYNLFIDLLYINKKIEEIIKSEELNNNFNIYKKYYYFSNFCQIYFHIIPNFQSLGFMDIHLGFKSPGFKNSVINGVNYLTQYKYDFQLKMLQMANMGLETTKILLSD
jgi:hypothetical protein